MADFSEDDANQWLEELAAAHESDGAQFHPVGGYKRTGKCEYDAYVAVGAKGSHGVSVAIRKPNERDPYFAIVRKSKNRRISEDKIPFTNKDIATELFNACLRVAELKGAAQTSVWNAELDGSSP